MSVNLQKGQKVELRKNNGNNLNMVMVGLGWDEAKKSRELFLSKDEDVQEIDCDASAFLCQGGKVVDQVNDVICYSNLSHSSGAVRHMGDNLTGEGDGDDEQIFVDLRALPQKYDRIIFAVNIFRAQISGQHFGMIDNCFIRICDENGTEIFRYNLSENYDNMTAMIFGEIYRYKGIWKFNAIGQPTKDNNYIETLKRFM